jgi:16S rRNA (guanine527-N7)-methyltransferase
MSQHPLQPALEQGLQALAIELPQPAVAQLLAYLDLIARWNKVYNLTAIRQPEDMLTQHLLDCLAILPALRRWQAGRGPGAAAPRLLDVGSGAGLPGVVLAICEPGWQVCCVDTVAKKASFIRQVGAELRLGGLVASHQRVEDMGDARFDLLTSRAFASLADFCGLTRQRLADGGVWAAMKARLSAEERAALPGDVELWRVEELTVPGLAAERCLVWMRPRPG